MTVGIESSSCLWVVMIWNTCRLGTVAHRLCVISGMAFRYDSNSKAAMIFSIVTGSHFVAANFESSCIMRSSWFRGVVKVVTAYHQAQ
jgi:hypothetical protein